MGKFRQGLCRNRTVMVIYTSLRILIEKRPHQQEGNHLGADAGAFFVNLTENQNYSLA